MHNGFFWETLWADSENAALKESRNSPFALRPGDEVHIPELRQWWAGAGTGALHRFQPQRRPAKLRCGCSTKAWTVLTPPASVTMTESQSPFAH